MKILIYGAGAVGLGLGSCLLKANETVDFVGRTETLRALKKKGLIRRGIFGNHEASPTAFNTYSQLNAIPKRSYDFILVTAKSFDSESCAQNLSKHLFLFHRETKIILFQNGWGNAEVFAKYFPKHKIKSARVITGFTRPQPNEVTITVHADAVRVGSLFDKNVKELGEIAKAITKGGLPCYVTKDVAKDLWAKMLYNCALNSLGAILDVPYGILGERAFTRQVMRDIIREVFIVMKKSGHQTHWKTPEEYLKVFYSKFLPPTYKHRSSTLQDIKAKKKTEIDSLNGVVIMLAQKHHISAPANHAVYQLVKLIEKRNKKD